MFRIIAIYLFMVIGLWSCDRIEIGEEEAKVSLAYDFIGIDYIINEMSHEKQVSISNVPISVDNYSSISQTFVFKPSDHVYETSIFYSSDTRAFSFVDAEQTVKTPTSISLSEVIDYDNRWTYTNQEQKSKPYVDKNDTIIILPNHRLVLISHFYIKELTTSYQLKLRGVGYQDTVTIRGQWSATMFQDYELEYFFEELINN